MERSRKPEVQADERGRSHLLVLCKLPSRVATWLVRSVTESSPFGPLQHGVGLSRLGIRLGHTVVGGGLWPNKERER